MALIGAVVLVGLVRAEPAAKADGAEPAGRTIRVRVVGPDGGLMAGARVHASIVAIQPVKVSNRDFVCDANGEATVARPQAIRLLRLWVRADGYVPLFAHWENEELRADPRAIPQQFTFTLKKGTVIGGLVKNEDGRPIAGAKVEVMLVDPRLNRRPDPRDRVGNIEWRMRYLNEISKRLRVSDWLAEGDDARITDAQGRWTLNNVPPGDDVEVRLRLSHPDYISDYRWGVMQEAAHVTMSELRDQTATILMARGIRLTGSVTDPQGKPVAGAVVVWGDDPYFMEGRQEVRTDDKGVYRFPPLPPLPVRVTVMAEGWAPDLKETTITRQNPPVDFQLEPGKKLRLRFVDASGKPVPGVHVGIDSWRGVKSLYNLRRNVLDTKIPSQADGNGVYEWTWTPLTPVTYTFFKEGYRRIEAKPYTADGVEHEVKLSR